MRFRRAGGWRYAVVLAAVAALGAAVIPSAGAISKAVQGTDAGPLDTLSYVLDTHGRALDGTHALSQTVAGKRLYWVKWAADSYETYGWDDAYVYHREDHSGAPTPGSSYIFSNGRWLKRWMRVGEVIDAPDNRIQHYTFDSQSCRPTTSGPFPYQNVLEAHIPRYQLGGTLGTQDVIVLRYDYRNGHGSDYEKIYYAQGWGMVKWELYRNGALIQTSIFNQVTSQPPTPPDLRSACIGVALPPPPAIPPLPVTIEDFVFTLYSCVLGITTPDTPGFTFWLNDLRRHRLTIQGAYTEFFGYQDRAAPTVSDGQFTRTLFGCILFRPIDQASYDKVIAGLGNGSLTRPGLVGFVLGSPEFTSGILPRLQALVPPA